MMMKMRPLSPWALWEVLSNRGRKSLHLLVSWSSQSPPVDFFLWSVFCGSVFHLVILPFPVFAFDILFSVFTFGILFPVYICIWYLISHICIYGISRIYISGISPIYIWHLISSLSRICIWNFPSLDSILLVFGFGIWFISSLDLVNLGSVFVFCRKDNHCLPHLKTYMMMLMLLLMMMLMIMLMTMMMKVKVITLPPLDMYRWPNPWLP